MKIRISALVAATALCFSLTQTQSIEAREVCGIDFPETRVINGKTCSLVGVGLRRILMFNVYLGAVYLETPTQTVEDILGNEEVKHVEMHLLFPIVEPFQIRQNCLRGVDRNIGETSPSLKANIERYLGFFNTRMGKGDFIAMTYSPGVGTDIVVNGERKGMIEGREFMQAMGLVWLGDHPPSKRFKEEILGLSETMVTDAVAAKIPSSPIPGKSALFKE